VAASFKIVTRSLAFPILLRIPSKIFPHPRYIGRQYSNITVLLAYYSKQAVLRQSKVLTREHSEEALPPSLVPNEGKLGGHLQSGRTRAFGPPKAP
jgi:hypothetical protein